jgi:phosphate transport system substrate-binding protein
MPVRKHSVFWLPLALVTFLTGALVLTACGDNAQPPVQTGQLPTLAPTFTPAPPPPLVALNRDNLNRTDVAATLTGGGSTFADPIYKAWIPAYTRNSPNVRIEYQASGSGNGRRALLGTPVPTPGFASPVDFAGSDAPFLGSELVTASQKGQNAQLIHFPAALGAVVLAYNLKEAPRLKLSGATLANIYLGKITRWNDPAIAAENTDVQLPDREIRVVIRARTESSGTSEIFTRYLSVVSDEFRGTVGPGGSPKWTLKTAAENGRTLEGVGNDGVSDQIARTDGAIGYVDQGVADLKKLAYAEIRNKTGRFIYPSNETVSAAAAGAFIPDDFRTFIVNAEGANTYPIAGFTWLIVWRDLSFMPNPSPQKAQALTSFLWWGLHEGQRTLPAGYAPLPESLVPRLERLFVGEADKVLVYQGKPLVQ